MKKYKLIEREAINQIELLPVVYKNLQYDIVNDLNLNVENNTIYIKSFRHQTPHLAAMRFYKNIEIFNI